LIEIREAIDRDWEDIWPIFSSIVSKGETYGIDPRISKKQGKHLWLESPLKTFVAVLDGEIVGTYYVKPNHAGPGSHVCNCGYMVANTHGNKGLATKMCKHSQVEALEMGFKAMQFNLVAASNERAIHLWQKMGFDIVGALPSAFNHPVKGFIDAFVMYKWLS